jgi:hypothetical protein
MKIVFAALFLALFSVSYTQEFEIPAEKYPFYDVIEWKGYGLMLEYRDPSLKSNQVHLINVSDKLQSTWEQSFNPIADEHFYIAEDGGKYAYFMNDISLADGKISFNQLNAAGNIKTSAVLVAPLIKRLGNYLMADLKVTEIITTEKSLVYLLTHMEKDKKTTIMLSMTHHNLVPYAVIVAENIVEDSKAEDQISWYVAGQEEGDIFLAARIHAGKEAGWAVRRYNEKAEFAQNYVVKSAGLKLAAHTRSGFGQKAGAMLNTGQPREQGTLVYAKGTYYVGGIEIDGANANIVTYKYQNEGWVNQSSSKLGAYNAKKAPAIGFFHLAEGIAWYNEAASEAHFHPFGGGAAIVTPDTPKVLKNPGRLVTASYPGKVIAKIPAGWVVFDRKQLPAQSPVKFEFVSK